MNQDEVRDLQHGLYRVFWKEQFGGGMSLAAVGTNFHGKRWIAPTNWVRLYDADNAHTAWDLIDHVELVETNA